MQHFVPATALLTLLSLSACTNCGLETEPTPVCYSGTVVGAACMDGALIEVDARYAIGQPSGTYTNLVAAVNTEVDDSLSVAGQNVRKGQVIHFTYKPSARAREAFCPQNTVPLPIPHLVLSNVGPGSCATNGAQ